MNFCVSMNKCISEHPVFLRRFGLRMSSSTLFLNLKKVQTRISVSIEIALGQIVIGLTGSAQPRIALIPWITYKLVSTRYRLIFYYFILSIKANDPGGSLATTATHTKISDSCWPSTRTMVSGFGCRAFLESAFLRCGPASSGQSKCSFIVALVFFNFDGA